VSNLLSHKKRGYAASVEAGKLFKV